MRRSKMIEKIEYLISTCDDHAGYPTAEQILDCVETAGMCPNSVVYSATGEFGTLYEVIEAAELDINIEWEDEHEYDQLDRLRRS